MQLLFLRYQAHVQLKHENIFVLISLIVTYAENHESKIQDRIPHFSERSFELFARYKSL